MTADMSLPVTSVASARAGVTLVELLVTLAILGLVMGAVSFATRSVPELTELTRIRATLSRARHAAVSEGRAITIEMVFDGRYQAATAHPNGSLSADHLLVEQLGIDLLTGEIDAAR